MHKGDRRFVDYSEERLWGAHHPNPSGARPCASPDPDGGRGRISLTPHPVGATWGARPLRGVCGHTGHSGARERAAHQPNERGPLGSRDDDARQGLGSLTGIG